MALHYLNHTAQYIYPYIPSKYRFKITANAANILIGYNYSMFIQMNDYDIITLTLY